MEKLKKMTSKHYRGIKEQQKRMNLGGYAKDRAGVKAIIDGVLFERRMGQWIFTCRTHSDAGKNLPSTD